MCLTVCVFVCVIICLFLQAEGVSASLCFVIWLTSGTAFLFCPPDDHIFHAFEINIQATRLSAYLHYSRSAWVLLSAPRGQAALPTLYQLCPVLPPPPNTDSSDGNRPIWLVTECHKYFWIFPELRINIYSAFISSKIRMLLKIKKCGVFF